MSSLEVLVVEDDKDFADSVAEMLELDGHQVTVLASGEEAVANYDEKAFDLVLLDIRLPGMSGLECLRAIRTINPIANVMIMTGAHTEQNRREAKDSGALHVLLKPFDPLRLRELVKHNFSTSGNAT